MDTKRAGEVPCPDPSAHTEHNKLSEQASSAALYVTDPARGTDPRENVLGSDGKLSSRSAAASLKYARPQDLPSYPSHGLNNADSAGKAAMLAKDYKMKDLWHPEMSEAGSKAALLAHKDGGKLDLWQPTASKDGNSAATIAMANKGLSPQLDRGYTPTGKHNALLAATLSVHKGRSDLPQPSGTPLYPDQHNAEHNALNAATVSHRASVRGAAPDGWDSDAMQAARVKNLGANMDPAMFTEHPPVEIERDEKKHDAALHASAVSMAKQMYQYQNRTVLGPDLTGKEGASAAAARGQPSHQLDVKQEALRYIHLQDAAHKLAQERLAKIDKSGEDARYREYYGYPDNQTSPKKNSMSRLSMRGRNRRRAGSNDDDLEDSDDEEQARRIRSQMSQLNSGLSSVDEKKRTDDRAKLLAAAEKKVHAQMHDMDEKVFADTGKVPPAMMEEWEAKARKRAQEQKEEQAQHPGQTHIGGGKFMAQSEIEAIAAARLKPTLDEINDTAEKRRARDEELRQEKEEQERTKREEKQKHNEEKAEQKRAKEEEKAAARKEKEEAKARKSEDRTRAKSEKRKSREVRRDDAAEVGGATAGIVGADDAANREDEDLDTKAEEKKRGGGMFGKITNRLRRHKEPEEENAKAEDTAMAGAKEHEKPTTTAALAATAGAAAGGIAVEDADKPSPAFAGNEAEDKPDALQDDKDEDEDEWDEPAYEPHPAVVPPVAGPASTGHTDVTSASTLGAPKPNLERHISNVLTSDEEDDDDDDFADPDVARNEDELAEKGRQHFAGGLDRDHENVTDGNLGQDNAQVVANRVGTAPISPLEGPADPPYKTNEATDETLPERDDHHYARDAAVAGGAGAAGVGAYEFLKSEGPSAKAVPPPASGSANVVDPQSLPDTDQAAAQAGDETGPAPHTIGPHSSDVANVVDPRVQPSAEEVKEKVTGSEPAPSPAVATGPTRKDEATQPEKDQKGIRGFFSKLRGRKPEDEKPAEPRNVLTKNERKGDAAAVGTAAAAPVAAGAAGDDIVQPHAGQDPGASAATTMSHDKPDTADAAREGAASPSSFKRGEAERSNLSDVSSSGAEEDGPRRGRHSHEKDNPLALWAKAEFGLGDIDKEGIRKSIEGGRRNDDDDHFEEARDNFDETLAPPPAFVGKKNESPHRETRFREEV